MHEEPVRYDLEHHADLVRAQCAALLCSPERPCGLMLWKELYRRRKRFPCGVNGISILRPSHLESYRRNISCTCQRNIATTSLPWQREKSTLALSTCGISLVGYNRPLRRFRFSSTMQIGYASDHSRVTAGVNDDCEAGEMASTVVLYTGLDSIINSNPLNCPCVAATA